MADLLMYTFRKQEKVQEKKNGNLWNLIKNRAIESLYKDDRDPETATFLYTMELLLYYMERDSVRE